ncbi:hypothetical protein O181_031932 [Austropuccinia psidii MF-1]|uniref:Integrase catalytic domain-containing protein n=1 Tax=Austropuccinia psidii MF-1 TaxID=1389203 RepID=A0A9Q3CYJ6_9BASI|nr:hypothetical protein [Austropuccinia psidii MF-1]
MFQKADRATSKKFDIIIQIQEPKSPWEIVDMYLVTAQPPVGDRSFNACLVLVDSYNLIPVFSLFHKYLKPMDTAIIIWNKFISHKGLFQNIIINRDPKFTSDLWINICNLSGTNLSFSKAYPPQADRLSQRMIQTLEEMVRRFCAYGLKFKDSDGFTHD